MANYKIHPGVIGCACSTGFLEDKSAIYPEDKWEVNEAKKLVERGFLVEFVEDQTVVEIIDPPNEEEVIEPFLNKGKKK